MQYSFVALAALAATASAHYNNGTVVYTTEVHTAYTTVCPAATELTFNGVTYTATEATTLTITNCPCTIVKPVTTSSVVAPSSVPTSAPVYTNATTAAPTIAPTTTQGSVGTTVIPTTKPSSTPIQASSGNKALALSGASLAGLLGLAAYLL
jgi:hypothetical protein